MAKFKCKTCGKPSESEYCFLHKIRKPLAKTGGFKISGKSKKNILYDKDKMWELFLSIWKQRGPYSEIDNTYLGKEAKSVFFDHLMPKENFPEVMYEEWNILIVSWEQHDNRHNGIIPEKYQEKINKAKEMYNNLFSNY